MNHRALRHIREALIAALGLAGCGEPASSVPEPVDRGVPDVAAPDPSREGCAGGVDIVSADGHPTGYRRCPDGAVDKVGPARCEQRIDLDPCVPEDVPEWAAEWSTCTRSADCDGRLHGHCVHVPLSDRCACVHACEADAECGDGQICACRALGEPLGSRDTVWAHYGSRCVDADCVGPESCDGDRCGVVATRDEGSCGFDRIASDCRSPDDACTANGQCRPFCLPPSLKRAHHADPERWTCVRSLAPPDGVIEQCD